MTTSANQRYYTFGGFFLDTVERRLLDADGKSISISSRAFDVLQYLLQHPGEIVDKSTLMAAVWPNTIVEENNLNQAITTLRKALGEVAGEYRFIITIPGRGYRFVPQVRTASSLPVSPAPAETKPVEENATTRGVASSSRPLWMGAVASVFFAVISFWAYTHRISTPPAAVVEKSTQAVTPATPPVPEKSVKVVDAPLQSVAVLPFVDMSPKKDQEYFADGVAEEVLNQLSRIRDLFVVGRMSSFSFKGRNEDLRVIGEKLGVSHILEGSVRMEGNRVRVSAQLVKAADGYQLWSQSYDRELDDIFAIQEDIAKSVADAMQISLGVGELGRMPGMTRNIEAYEAYLAGRSLTSLFTRENVSQAIEQFERAVALDPDFAVAWNALASICNLAASTYIPERSEEFTKKAEAAASRAIALAPESVASTLAAQQQYLQHREYVAAEQSSKKAQALAPRDYQANFLYALFLLQVGRPSKAVAYFQRAIRAEPLFVNPVQNLGVAYEMSGNYDAARKQFEQAKNLENNNTSVTDTFIVTLAMETDDRDRVDAFLEKSLSNDLLSPADRSFQRSLLGKPEDARSALNRFFEDPAYQNNPFVLSVIGIWAAYFGDQALALKAYQVASKKSLIFFSIFLWRPILKEMRRLPGFKDIVVDLKLVDYWRATGNWGEFCHPVGEDDFECK